MTAHQELLQQEKQAQRKAEMAAWRAKGMYEIFKAHPTVINCQANQQAIDAQLGDDVTLENFDHDFNVSQEFRAKLALQTLEQAEERAQKTKRNLVNKIIDLMIVSPDSANAVAKQLFYLSIPELEQRIRQIDEKQRLNALPKEQVRQIVKQNDEVRRAQKSRPFIPLEIQAREIRLMSVKELKNLIFVYGNEQVNARLNGSDHKQQEAYLKQDFNV
jgi:hypothetical protein